MDINILSAKDEEPVRSRYWAVEQTKPIWVLDADQKVYRAPASTLALVRVEDDGYDILSEEINNSGLPDIRGPEGEMTAGKMYEAYYVDTKRDRDGHPIEWYVQLVEVKET